MKKDWQKIDIAHKLLQVLAEENVSNTEASEIIDLLTNLKNETVLVYEFPKPVFTVPLSGCCDTLTSPNPAEEAIRRL